MNQKLELLPNKVIVKKGSKSVLLKTKGQNKEKVTGFILARADGKLCKMLQKGKIYREVSKINNNTVLCVTQKKAWYYAEFMNQWIDKVWKIEPGQRKLLILDNFSLHRLLEEKLEY